MKPSEKGTYILILVFDRSRQISVGRLGIVQFEKGYYAYVGSAFGPGGMESRIRHHLAPKARRHWHMDYLDVPVREAWLSQPEARLEHQWAAFLGRASAGRIPGFGCSDCGCDSHLFHFRTVKDLDRTRKGLGLKKSSFPLWGLLP